MNRWGWYTQWLTSLVSGFFDGVGLLDVVDGFRVIDVFEGIVTTVPGWFLTLV